MSFAIPPLGDDPDAQPQEINGSQDHEANRSPPDRGFEFHGWLRR
jgi:hypothetical protein